MLQVGSVLMFLLYFVFVKFAHLVIARKLMEFSNASTKHSNICFANR